MIRRLVIVLCFILFANSTHAKAIDYTELFEVDLEEDVPSLRELQEKYYKPNEDYDRKYDYHWNIGDMFDQVFKQTIISYGSSNIRTPHSEEKNLEKLLSLIPKEYYEYIGPYLHTVPYMPEKILNMPGIKETKNKFPTRVAKELQDMEDLEFLSPHLYFLLIPEFWSSYRENLDVPKGTPRKIVSTENVRVNYDPEFYKKLRELVPEDDYLPNAEAKKSIKSELRTINITKSSPLTAADIRAVNRTFSAVKAFGDKDYNVLKLSAAGSLLEAWEVDNGKGLPIQSLKGLVNPCKRLVQKIKLAGLEYEFLQVVGKEGFTLDAWAYTCDKTIKAYRVITINGKLVPQIARYQQKLYENINNMVDDEDAQQQYAVMQSLSEMYKAPMDDILEAHKEKDNLYKELIKINGVLIDTPIALNF